MGEMAERELKSSTRYLPREHGATAMVLTPMVAVAILARAWDARELLLPMAAIAAMGAKDPLVLLLRERLVWKRRHADSANALRWFAGWMAIFLVCTGVILEGWPVRATMWMSVALGVFAILAIAVNVKNQQRSTLFQIASGAALSSSAVAMCLTITGGVATWCWWFWGLMTLQASAGILVVHARLDARLALRGKAEPGEKFRRAAIWFLGLMGCTAIYAALQGRAWVAIGLAVAVAGFGYDLYQQRSRDALELPLKKVGQRSLALSMVYAVLMIVALW